ncbi:MAG: hypothetical protein KGI37_06640 [Alphaproteobacteria bacterium]|nr:hypothetical protein [Alphaproteobacteria bacterium]
MSIIQDVEQFFENLWNNVLKPDVQKAEQVVEVFFQQAETAVENELGVEGLKIVTDAVSAAELAGGSGPQKLQAAQAAIASDLSAANLANVAQNTINVAIEGAVAQLKSSQTQDASQQQGGAAPAAGNDNGSGSTGSSPDSTGPSTK